MMQGIRSQRTRGSRATGGSVRRAATRDGAECAIPRAERAQAGCDRRGSGGRSLGAAKRTHRDHACLLAPAGLIDQSSRRIEHTSERESDEEDGKSNCKIVNVEGGRRGREEGRLGRQRQEMNPADEGDGWFRAKRGEGGKAKGSPVSQDEPSKKQRVNKQTNKQQTKIN